MSLADQQWCPASVQVTVLQARGLRIKGKSGTNDAYAVMQVGKEKYQTSVAEKSVAPVWKEEATFDLPQLQQGGGGGGAERTTLHVHVLHRALVGPDKLLGQAVINLLQLSEDRTRNKSEWFKLLDKTGKADKDRGEVLVDIQFMRNNMTASMFDLSGAGKSRSRLGKIKDKVRGKKKESDASSTVVQSFSQVLTDSEEEGNGDAGKDEKKKKHKMKSLFSPKSNLQKSMSQSMSVLPAKNSSLSGSQSSGLNVDSSEGKKKFKFKIHKRSGSSDSKDSSSGHQKHGAAEQSNLCINGSHVYCEEPPPRTSRIGSNFSLTSSGHGSMEDVPESSPPSVDSLRAVRQYSPWTEEEEEGEEQEEIAKVETIKEDEDEFRREEEEERNRLMEERMRKEAEEERLKRQAEEAEEKRWREEQERKRIEEEENRQRQEEEEKMRIEEEMAQEERRRQEEERKLAEEKRRLEEEERRRIEEEKVRREEERRRLEEEERVRKEEAEQKRLAEEKKRLEEEESRRIEEERVRKEEEMRIQKEEEERVRRQEEEWLAEEKRKRVEEQERRRIEEEKQREEEEWMRMEEEKAQEERKRQEEEERARRQEEERKLAEEKRKREEEESRIEQERVRKDEEERIRRQEEVAEEARRIREEEGVRRQEEEHNEKMRLEEQERRRREEEEKIRKEEEEKARREYERLVEEKRKIEEEEERKRIEAEAKIRKEEEERIKMEEEKRRKEEEENVRRQEEERKRLAEEKRIQEEQERKRVEEEKRQREEEEMIRREEERARKEKEEYERQVEEQKRQERRRLEEEERIRKEEQEKVRVEEERSRKQQEEEEKSKREEEERMRREEQAERERKEKEARDAEEQKKRESKVKQKAAVTTSKVTSTNPFDENYSENPGSCRRNPSAVSAMRSKAVTSNEKERRAAPQPPGRNQAERPSQREPDRPTRHLTQINKQSKDKDVKTVSVHPQRSVQMIAPLSRSPAEAKSSSSQSSTIKGAVAKHTKRPAPSRPPSVEEQPSLEPKAASSSDGNISPEGGKIVYGLNPFEDDEDEPTAQEDTATGSGPAAADGKAATQAKDKSSKRSAPPLPAGKAPTSSAVALKNTEGDHVVDAADTALTDSTATHPHDPERSPDTPMQELKPAMVQSTGEEAGGKKEAPPAAPRRLLPVKPVNPLRQQAETDNKSTGILCAQEKTQVNDTGLKGPYSQLTREELISLMQKQEVQLSERDKKISELERYIDNLLVRVMEENPSILMSMNAAKKSV